MREYYEIWWEHITGPMRFVERIERNINDDKCTVLCVPITLPWGDEFREVIIKNIINAEKWFEIIDDDQEKAADVGNYLLQRFAEEKIKTSYAYYSHNTPIEKYLKNNEVLKDKVLLIKNVSGSSLSKWTTFLRRYKSRNNNEGTFILETNEQFNGRGTICVIKYNEFVSIYDAHLFTSIVASQSSNEELLHQYITHLADSLCEMNVELMVKFIENIDFNEDDIISSYSKYFHISVSELAYKVWKAQIQVAFPLIEVARVNFVRKYEDSIKDCLPVEQFEENVENPYEVELGRLIYLLSSKFEEDREKRLVISCKDYEDIHFLHKIRNKLAHVKYCSSNEIYTLLLNNFFDNYL